MTDEIVEWPARRRGASLVVLADAIGTQPHSGPLVDALRDQQQRMDHLEDLMIVQGRTKVPPTELLGDWVRPDDALLQAGRPLARHGIRWVPRQLMAEFLSLHVRPLPTSAGRRS